jgi:hypothetical protein
MYRPRYADRWALLALGLVILLWFHRFSLEGQILIPPNANSLYPWAATTQALAPHPQGSMDAVRENYITWALHKAYLEAGQAPYWQPYFLSGNPLLANQFSTPYSPYKLLNLLFSAPVAWSLAMMLKAWLNGAFTYGVARLLGRSPAAAMLAALAWMLSWPLAHQTQTTYNEGVAWMPALLFCCLLSWQSAARPGQVGWAAAGAILAGFQFLAGNIQMTVYSALLLGGFALYWSLYEARSWRPLGTFLVIYSLGVLVGAAQLLSSYELLSLSIRGSSQTHLNKGIEPYTGLSFFNPWLYFWQNFEFPALRDQYWLNYRWNPYIGLGPLFMLGTAAFFSRERVGRAILALSLGTYALLHLLYLRPVFNLASQLPFYDALDQSRLLIVLSFPLALAAAFGLDWFLAAGRESRRFGYWVLAGWLALGLILAGGGALQTFFQNKLAQANRLGDSWPEQEAKIGTAALADYYRLDNPLFAAGFALMAGGLLLVMAYRGGYLGRQGFSTALLLLTAADLALMAQVNVAGTPAGQVYPTTPAIEWLQAQPGPFRLTSAPNTLLEGREAGPYRRYQDDHGWFMAGLMPPLVMNTPALFGLHDVRGYESVYTLRYSEYMAALDGRADLFSAVVIPETYRGPMLDLLNTRYILSVEPLPDSDLPLVYQGEVYIYENPAALPRAQLYASYQVLEGPEAVLAALSGPDFVAGRDLYFEAEPGTSPPNPLPKHGEGEPDGGIADSPSLYSERGAGGEVFPELAGAGVSGITEIIAYEPNRVVIRTDSPSPAILVLADAYYPGWQARVNGQAATISRANYILRAVEVPAGPAEVVFTYDPPLIRAGLAVSVLSFLALALMSLGSLGYTWRKQI